MTLEQVEAELAEIETAMKPLAKRQNELDQLRHRLLSQRFIAANSITRADVQKSASDDMPYFTHVNQFIDWLKKQSPPKRFAEWNGQIHFTSDLIAGRFRNNHATVHELTK